MTTAINMYQEVTRILQDDISPLVNSLHYLMVAVGVVFVIVGITRCKHHYQGYGQQRHSPLATFFYFFSGTILVGYSPEIVALSQSTFGIGGAQSFLNNANNPVLYYIQQAQNNQTDTVKLLKDLVYGVLLLIGMVAFIRGFMLMVKAGEGHGQDAVVSKALTHIIAGIVGINAPLAVQIMNNF